MEESTPIFDALWEKYNATPIFDQVLREHEAKKYLELVEPYKYPLNDKRVFDPAEFVEMMTSNEILSPNEIRALFNIPPTDADYALTEVVRQITYEEFKAANPSPALDIDKLFPDKPDVSITNEDRYRWANMVRDAVAQHKENKLMTSNWQDLVNEFREVMDLPVSDGPRQLTSEEAELHIQMIRDEFEKEFVPFARSNNLIEFYDAGIDLIVYILGAMSNAGMDVDPGFVEIIRSNMSKMDPVTKKPVRSRGVELDGEPKGKILKGAHYSPPALGKILNEQTTYGHEDDHVYKNLTIPLTLGIGGPKIGEGTLNMDHNGNLMYQGVMMDVSILPILDHLGLTVSGLSMGPDEPEVESISVEEEDLRAAADKFHDGVINFEEAYIQTFDPPILFNESVYNQHNNPPQGITPVEIYRQAQNQIGHNHD